MASQTKTLCTGSDDAGVGTLAWSNPTNIGSDDNAYAECVNGGGPAESHYLFALDFGFTIPAGATIDGIRVTWRRFAAMGTPAALDAAVRIIKGGAVGTENKSTGASWSSTEQADLFGGISDLWSETWTAADINAAGFGAALSATVNGLFTASVDNVQLTVNYTDAPAGAAMPSAISRMVNQLVGR